VARIVTSRKASDERKGKGLVGVKYSGVLGRGEWRMARGWPKGGPRVGQGWAKGGSRVAEGGAATWGAGGMVAAVKRLP
jgi:hypothetical protein